MGAQQSENWVLLDAMGVVFHVGDDVSELLVPFVRERTGVPRRVVEASYLEATLGRSTSKTFWEAVGLAAEYPAVELEYLEQSFQVNDGIEEAMMLLMDASFKVGLVSNDVPEWSRRLRHIHDLDRWLQCVIVSGDAGYRKPDVQIYESFLTRTSARPGDCVAVDDRSTNLRAAASIGIQGILFDSEVPDDWPGLKVDSFRSLPAVVGTALHPAER